MLKLKERLSMAADMVRRGSRLADIGTDHAYLPAVLIIRGIIPSAVAADLKEGPLENAESTVRSCGIADKVDLRISDGLNAVSEDEADDIVIAGMGGILISEILRKAPWVKNKNKKLILQPQSHDEKVREYLWENGFEITEEKACFEDGKVYICLSAQYTGKTEDHTDAEYLLGSFLNKTDRASEEFRNKKLKRVKTREKALSEKDKDNPEIIHLRNILNEVSE